MKKGLAGKSPLAAGGMGLHFTLIYPTLISY